MSKKVETKDLSDPAADTAVAGEVSARPRLPIPRKQAAILLLALCLLVAGIVSYIVAKPSTKKNATSVVGASQVCSDDLITKASAAIDKNDEANLANFKKQILGLKGYDHDLNCVYILERYALLQFNVQDAQKYSAMLKPLFSSQTYSKKFTIHTFSPKQIDQVIASLQENNDFQAQQDASQEAKMRAMDQLQDQSVSGQKR